MNREHIGAQILLRAWPFPRGAGRLIDKWFRDVPFLAEQAVVQTTDGFLIAIKPNELIGRHIYLTGEFDRTNVELLCNFAEPDDTLLDIGANIGYVSACFLQSVPGSQAIAVEPQPAVVDLLRKNLTQFTKRATIYPVALSDRGGEMPFVINHENNGASHLACANETGSVTVPVIACDEFFTTNHINKIDLVKIDVEGHEPQVLGASAKHLQRLQPRAILFEDHRGASNRVLTGILNDIGYDVFGIKKRLTKISLLRDCFATNDYIAVSRHRPQPLSARKKYSLTA